MVLEVTLTTVFVAALITGLMLAASHSLIQEGLAAIQELSWQGFVSSAGHHDNALYDALVGHNR